MDEFACTDTESVNPAVVAECVSTPGALKSDTDFGTRWGTGCAGDSGGAWLMDKGEGASPRYAAVGVNRAAGKAKKENGEWDMDDDQTFNDGACSPMTDENRDR